MEAIVLRSLELFRFLCFYFCELSAVLGLGSFFAVFFATKRLASKQIALGHFVGFFGLLRLAKLGLASLQSLPV